MELGRREFLRLTALGVLGLGLEPLMGKRSRAQELGFLSPIKSPYFEPVDGKTIQCTLCPRGCVLEPGERGHCGVRENRSGELWSLAYGNPCALHIDPIEKKPFFHVLPGAGCLSYAMAGCNLDCLFCQNWQISQTSPDKTRNLDVPPDKMVALARKYSCPAIAATYTEPTVFFEYNLEVARLCKAKGVLFTFHSNGFINPEPLEDLLPYLGAACVDLKGFSEDYYRRMSNGELRPVLETLKAIHSHGVHLEIVNLMVPGENDDPGMVREMCQWIRESLAPWVPLHFTRFFPMYRLRNLAPTPVNTLERAREIALEVGLQYVYLGNVPGHPAENTHCPRCGELLIRRRGFFVLENRLKDGRCPKCGRAIEGVWTI